MPQNFSPNTWVVQRLEALRVSLATLEAPKGSVCPVGTCRRRWQSDPERTGGKRQPSGLLRAAQSDPKVDRKEACARWALATEGGKATRRREQIQALRAASAHSADVCEERKRALAEKGAACALFRYADAPA